MDLRYTLRYLGVGIKGKSYTFGDNKSMVDSATLIDAKLNKRHTMLSFHGVREVVAFGICAFYHIDGTINPADILLKHWSYNKVKDIMWSLLFHEGDTMELWKEKA